eukprot:TRINITY_DN16838_c0_g1_i1.p1 TRINITY_DN16838_c0_g1~~TRINITY_DN16838_c0_g1_i1.p1  ORF type:complete len:265 (+),score=47.03 TRINITY_DN16838_c0_g1_i1:30-797(+)
MGCCQSNEDSPGDVIWSTPAHPQRPEASYHPGRQEHFEEIDLGGDRDTLEVSLDEVALSELDHAFDDLTESVDVKGRLLLDEPEQVPQVHILEAQNHQEPTPISRLRRPSDALGQRMRRLSQGLPSSQIQQQQPVQPESQSATIEEEEEVYEEETTTVDESEASFYDQVHEDEIQYQALALWAFEGDVNQWQITFEAGDIIGVIDAHPEEDWWIGAKGNQKGYFPRTYVEVIKKDIKARTQVSGNIARLQSDLNF